MNRAEVLSSVKHPDYSYEYKWVDKNEIELPFNKIWKPVNDTNHSHINGQGYSGGIVYKNSVILCFTERKFKEKICENMVGQTLLEIRVFRSFSEWLHCGPGLRQ